MEHLPESDAPGPTGKQMSPRQRHIGQIVGNIIALMAIVSLAWALYHHFS